MTVTINAPLDLPCGARLSNRIAKSALTEGLADPMNRATDKHERLYRLWSEGGAGLLVTGNVQVDRTHLERPGNVVIDGNGGLAELKAYAKAGTVAGNHLWMQINHPGRQTPISINRNPLAPSAVPLAMAGDRFGPPREATEAEIHDLIRRFAHVATTAREAGFTGVQVHAAHGYLVSQFLSPLANRRTDDWGGSLANRARFLLEVVRGIRAAVGRDFPVSIKLNSADFQQNGFTNDEAIQVARWLEEAGLDLLELSGGTYEQLVMIGGGDESDAARPVRDSTKRREAYFLEYADLIKSKVRMPVMVTGGFRTVAGMNRALESGATDLIGLGRPMCVDVDAPRRLLTGIDERTASWENRLHLQPGEMPEVADPAARAEIDRWAPLGWFCLQLIRIGEGRGPDPAMPLSAAFIGYAENEAATEARMIRPTAAAAAQ